MKKAILRLLPVLISAGILTISCTKEQGTRQVTGPKEGKGFYSLSLGFNDILKTRADEFSAGLPEEGRVSNVRVILYDAETLQAEIIYNCHSIEYNNVAGEWTWNGDEVFTITSDTEGRPQISLISGDVGFKDYKVLVLINPLGGTSSGNLGSIYLSNEWGSGTTYADASALKGHSLDIFTEHIIDVNGAGILQGSTNNPGMDYYYGAMSSLLSLPQTYGSTVGMDYDNYDPDLGYFTFLMTNADGVITIRKEDIKSSRTEAEGAPMSLNVERSVAKVALYKSFDQLSRGATVVNAGWTCDILNTKWYPVRKKAETAPAGGGNMENRLTDRRYRYAEDPNFDEVSHERPGNTASGSPSGHFFRIGNVISSGFDSFFKEWNTNNGDKVVSADSDDYTTRWEYVTENTMLAEEQYEDVTTRVVIYCNYVPGTQQSIAGTAFADLQSFYYYGGYAFTHQELTSLAALPESIPIAEYPSLVGLEQVLADPAALGAFGWIGAPSAWTEPTASVSHGGLRFYLEGECYYYILIRHFSDTDSPNMMEYGRYGVVRNNLYKIFVKDIKGPGSITIPEPEGPDDKENVVEAEIIVAPWRVVSLYYQL